MEPCDGAVILFSSPDHAQQFVDKDPYNTGGLVTKYQVGDRGRGGVLGADTLGLALRQEFLLGATLPTAQGRTVALGRNW